jgi:uncharacterized protein (DUF924 family)
VVVFDQFSRNLFRDSPEAFATDAPALALARDAVNKGLDGSMSEHGRHFLCMPFMHSEDPAMQARSIQLFRANGSADLVGYAERHKSIIDRFGRFPHRNKALGRDSTVAELLFLRNEWK